MQASHAAIESTKKWPYIGDHPHLVVIGIKNEAKLKKAFEHVLQSDISAVPFIESDGQFTAFATRPIINPEERLVFKKYQLLR